MRDAFFFSKLRVLLCGSRDSLYAIWRVVISNLSAICGCVGSEENNRRGSRAALIRPDLGR